MVDSKTLVEVSQNETTNDEKPLTLRDHLAMERTSLANERTLLAYARTAILLAGSGLTLIKLQSVGPVDKALAASLLLTALIVAALGVRRFRRVRKRVAE